MRGGRHVDRLPRPGAEGATAPETLRQKDRKATGTLESERAGIFPLSRTAPKE